MTGPGTAPGGYVRLQGRTCPRRGAFGEEGRPREMEHGRNAAIDLDGRATHYS